jgi:acyl-CoA-dependent ceramide synthase
MPNASHDSKNGNYWTTGYAGPFRSDAAGFGHPLTALHNFTRACLGLSYAVPEYKTLDGTSLHHDDLRFGHSYVDRYPWNSWTSHQSRKERTGLLEGTYFKGSKDVFLILTFILVITMFRALAIRYVLLPLGRRIVADEAFVKTGNARLDEAGRRKWRKSKRKHITRFAEQFWSVAYYTCSLSLSLYVAHSEPYWMNEVAVWAQWPYKELTGLTKVREAHSRIYSDTHLPLFCYNRLTTLYSAPSLASRFSSSM